MSASNRRQSSRSVSKRILRAMLVERQAPCAALLKVVSHFLDSEIQLKIESLRLYHHELTRTFPSLSQGLSPTVAVT